MAYVPNSGSVVAFQSDPSKLQASVTGTVAVVGSVITINTPVGNQSVSGTVGASIIGLTPVVASVSGVAGASIIGLPTVQTGNNSVIALIQGSIAAIGVAVPNQSVSGTVGASIIGLTPVNISGGVSSVALVGANTVSVVGTVFVAGSVAAIGTPVANQSVSGTVGASIIGLTPVVASISGQAGVTQVGAWTSSVVGSVSGYIQSSGGSVITLSQSSSIIAINAGSVVAIPQGSVITLNQGSSILAVPVGSVVTVLQAPSIVGTYAEDAASATGDKGLFVLGVRNDTMASITSADGDYSGMVQGPIGETIVANSPITKWVQGTVSILGGASLTGGSVVAIAAQGASIFTYITAVQLANMGPSSVLVTFGGATSSVVGYSIAPIGGGSNIIIPNAWKTNANGAFTASISGVASIFLSTQGFISKT